MKVRMRVIGLPQAVFAIFLLLLTDYSPHDLLPTTYYLLTTYYLRLTGVPQAVFIMSLPETTRASPKSATLMSASSAVLA